MIASPNWSLSKVTLTLKDGSTVEGTSAQVYEDNAGSPVLVQVTQEGDTKSSVRWDEIVSIEHA